MNYLNLFNSDFCYFCLNIFNFIIAHKYLIRLRTSDIIGISLAVTYGDIFLGQHEGISFSKSSTGSNLTFIGTIGDINAALTTLIYRPFNDWNSIVGDKVNPVISSVQKLTISSDTPTSMQIITSTISDARSTIAISTESYFTLALNCSEFIFSSIFPQNVSLSNAPMSDPIASNAPASFVQSKINKLLKECYNLYHNGYGNITSLDGYSSNVQTPASTIVTRFPETLSNSLDTNTFSWSVAFFTPLITTMTFPLLRVQNHLLIAGSIDDLSLTNIIYFILIVITILNNSDDKIDRI
jgi:hypothetical protein